MTVQPRGSESLPQYEGIIETARAALGDSLDGEHTRRIKAAGRQAEYTAQHRAGGRLTTEELAEVGCAAALMELARIEAELKPIKGGSPEAPEAKPARKASLTLTIAGTAYFLRRVACPDASAALACYTVRKRGTEDAYHVSQHRDGLRCTCPDWVFKREHKDARGCKHVRALAAVGLLAYTVDEINAAMGVDYDNGPFPRKVRRDIGLPLPAEPEPTGDFRWATGGHGE